MKNIFSKLIKKKTYDRTRMIYKLSLTAMFLCLTFILMIGQIVIFPPFLKTDFSIVPLLICTELCGLIPGLIVGIITPLIHIAVDTGGGPVGALALILDNIVLIFLYILASYLLKYIFAKKDNKKHWIECIKIKNFKFQIIFWITVIVFFSIIILIVSFTNIFWNWAFLLKLYGIPPETGKWFITILFPFNIIKHGMNIAVFLLVFPLIYFPTRRYTRKI